MRSIWSGVLATLLALAFTTVAWAQNGLERFEKELKPHFEAKTFTYASAAPLGNSGFVLDNVVAVVPANPATGDKESTVKIRKVTVDALDFDRVNKDAKEDETPRFAKLKLEGVTSDDDAFGVLQSIGMPSVPLDFAVDYTLDPKTKVLDVKLLEVKLHGMAKLSLSLVMDGISDKASEMAGAKDDGRLRIATLTVDDTGLLARLLPSWAKEEGAQPDELVQTALTAIAAFAAQQGPETLKALDAVASFVSDWKAPKGPLVVGLKPAKTAGLSDLDKVAMPDALTTEFGFTATYPGTKAGAAKGGVR